MKPQQPVLFWSTLAVIVMALMTGVLEPKRIDYIPHCFKSPTLAIELPRGSTDLQVLLDGQGSATRLAFRRQTLADYLFILCYVFLWFRLTRRISWVLASVVILAGIADCFENLGILRGVASVAPSQAIADATRYPSLIKWTLLGVAFSSMLYLFWPRDPVRNGWQVLELGIGLCYAWGGVLCFAGALFQNLWIERALLPLSAALVLQLSVFAFAPVREPVSGAPVATDPPR
jgi:hypothetical protein